MGRTETLLKKGWVVVIALVVAFALGGGVGGVIEHQRLKDKSNQSSSGVTTPRSPAAVVWFKTPTTAACPALKGWQAAAAAAYVATIRKTPWTTTKAALLAQNAAATTSLKKLLPMTTPAGRAGVNFLVTTEGRTSNALKHAASQADYATAAKALATPRVARSKTIMGSAAKACATTT